MAVKEIVSYQEIMENNVSNITKYILLILTPSTLAFFIFLLSQKNKDWFIITGFAVVFVILSIMAVYMQVKSDDRSNIQLQLITQKLEKISSKLDGTTDFNLEYSQVDRDFILNELKNVKNELEEKNQILLDQYVTNAFNNFINNNLMTSIDYIHRAISISDLYWLHLFLGNIYILQSEYKSAFNHFEIAYQKKKNSETLLSMGNINFIFNELDIALNYYNLALGNNIDAVVYFNMAVTYNALANQKSAEEFYKSSLLIRPQNIPTLYNLANLYLNLQKFTYAKEYYDKVFELNYKEYGINEHYTLGLFYQRQVKNELAIREYLKSIKKYPQDQRAYVNLTNTYIRTGQFSKGLNIIKKAPVRDFRYYAALGNCYFNIGEYLLAIDNYQESLRLNTVDVLSIFDKLFQAFIKIGNKDKAIKTYESALKLGYTDHELLFNMALFYEKEKNCKLAQKYYKRDIGLYDKEKSYINITRLLLMCNKYDEALRYLNVGVSKYPSSSSIHNNYAMYYFYKNDFKSAKKHLITALKNDPNNNNARVNLEKVEKKLNDI